MRLRPPSPGGQGAPDLHIALLLLFALLLVLAQLVRGGLDGEGYLRNGAARGL